MCSLTYLLTYFPVAGHDIWNSLPATIRTIDPAFRSPSRHICYAQHLTISFYINIDSVMHNRSIFNLYDWAL